MKSRKNLKRKLHFLVSSYAILLVLLILRPNNGLAGYPENTTLFEFPNDVKYYSLTFVFDGDIGRGLFWEETMAAGTIFGYPNAGFNSPHLLITDRAGNLVTSKAYDFSSDFMDVRSVSVTNDSMIVGSSPGAVPYNSRTYYVTCLARPNSSNDRILIMPVRLDGSLVSSPYTIKSNNPNEGLYPLNSLFIHGSLYICGYVTDNNTNLPTEPGYIGRDHKKGFVIKIQDAGSSTPTIIGNITINTNCSPLPAPPAAQNHDFDIAMSMKMLNNGNIHVTGSVNNEKVNSIRNLKSAVMNLVVDSNLSTVVNDDHFSTIYYDGLHDEYGTTIAEDVSNACNYIVNNQFVHLSGTFTGPYTTFDTEPTYMNVTYVDGTFNHISTNPTTYTDNSFNSQWGLEAVGNQNGPMNPSIGYDEFYLYGMTIGQYCNVKGAAFGNVLPFLSHLRFSYSPGTGITGTLLASVSYQTKDFGFTGTGTGPYPGVNGYPQLGGGLSNWGWGPWFGAWPNDNFNLIAPRYTSASLQGVKLLHTDANGYESTCGSGSYIVHTSEVCGENINYSFTEAINDSIIKQYGSLSLSINNATPTINSYMPTGGSSCVSGAPNYKTGTSISTVHRGGKTVVYPNPANNYIFVIPDVNTNKSTSMKVELVNIIGSSIQLLYTGTSENLVNTKLNLPKITSGLYIIQVYADNKIILNQKLVIQQ